MAFFGLVDFAERDDVRVVQDLKNLGFLKGLLFFSFAHAGDVDLLDDAEIPVALALDQECLSESALAQELFLDVDFKLLGLGTILRVSFH